MGDEHRPIGDEFDHFLEQEIAEKDAGRVDPAWTVDFVFPGETVTLGGAEVRLLADALNGEGTEEALALVERIPLSGDFPVSAEDAHVMRAAWNHVATETDRLAELHAALDGNAG